MSSLSVVIPFYKDHAYVEQAVHSVLIQRIRDLEIIVVNDNPSEQTQRFLHALNFPELVRIVAHDENRGLSAARNTGVREARGTHIAYLDADDYYLPGGLSAQFARALRTRADITHATTMLRTRKSHGQPHQALVGRDRQFFLRDIDNANINTFPELQFVISSWKSIYRRQHLIDAGIVFDEAQRKFEDRLYVLENMFSGATVALMAEPTRIWRRREGSITTSKKLADDLKMMANLIDKCTGLVARRVEEQQLDPAFLAREIYHSSSRLVWDTGLLNATVGEDDLAHELQATLTRALSRGHLSQSIFSDKIVRVIDRTGTPNSQGITVDSDQLIAMQHAIVGNQWPEVKRIWVASGGMRPEPELSAPSIPAFSGEPNASLANVGLTLHIGLHKTGTTHLQHQLRANRAELAEQGWLFPEAGFVDHSGVASKSEATPGHQGLIHAAVHNDHRLHEKLIGEIVDSGSTNVLISCENMSFPHLRADARRQRIAALNAFFNGFGKRRVVATLRRPDTYFEALYRERVANSHLRETRTAIHFLEALGDAVLDYAGMLEPWKQMTNNNLLLLSYEDLSRKKDYFGAFCAALGMPALSSKHTQSRTYSSPDREIIEVMRIINALTPVGDTKSGLSRSFMNGARKLAKPSDQSVLDIDTRKMIVERVRANSADFLKSAGMDYPFDGMISDIEAERNRWQPIASVDHRLVQMIIHAAQLQESKDRWQVKALDKTKSKPKAAKSARPKATRAVVKQSVVNGAKSRNPGNPKSDVWLRSIYRYLPSPAKRIARALYGRIKQ